MKGRRIALCLLAIVLLASQDGHGDVTALDNGGPNLAADATMLGTGNTGAWFDPGHEGEGFLLEILADGVALVYWFTYDIHGNQRWFVGVGSFIEDRVTITELLAGRGARFGEDFDPGNVSLPVVGSLEMTFDDCDTGVANYNVDGMDGEQNLTRLTTLKGLPCGSDPTHEGSNLSGSWSGGPTRDGEGFVVQIISDETALVYWFTYTPDGRPAWIYGIARIDPDGLHIDEALLTFGGRFGDNFDPTRVQLLPWGQVSLQLGCDGGQLFYVGSDDEEEEEDPGYFDGEPGYGAGGYDLSRLTILGIGDCD